MSSPRTRIARTKRACDGCQIRKVKCDGGQPCLSCANTTIACTFSRTVHTRGPRRMRETTRNIIERIQREGQRQLSVDDESTGLESKSTDDPAQIVSSRQGSWKRTPVAVLAPQLYIYHVRMFPVWPIVDVDTLIAELQHGDQDSHDKLEIYALATSIIAATVAQLRLDRKEGENTYFPRASDMVYECQKACNLIRYRSRINLNTIRISFFLHIYHENQQPGCGESLLYLREAISVAQLMSLHQEKSYTGRVSEEQNLRRWVLWLLFVTERGVCLLHKMPVIIKTNIALPSISWHDGQSVLPAFIQLINLFWTFEQAGLFDVIGDRDNTDFSSMVRATAILDSQTVESLHRQLHQVAKDPVFISDVQKVDIYVTRHWMKMILWKLRSSSSSSNDMSVAFPLSAASDFLNTVTGLPTSAIEAHGLTIQLKIVEIASSVVDSISHLATRPIAIPTWTNDLSPSRILTRLHLLMSSFRHEAASSLVDLLCQKTADVHSRTGLHPPISSRSLLDSNSDHSGTALDEDSDETTELRQNTLPLLTYDHELSSVETSLVLSSANDLLYGYSNQCRDDTPGIELDASGELPTTIFDHRVDQEIICASQQRPDSTLNLFNTLLNNEESASTLGPFTPSDYEHSHATLAETFF